MKPQVQTGILIAVIILAILLGVMLLYDLAPLLLLVVIAIVFTTGIDPFVQKLHSIHIAGHFFPRSLATIIVMLVAVFIILGIITVLVITAINESITFAQNTWPEARTQLLGWATDLSKHYTFIPKPAIIYRRLSAQSGQFTSYIWSTTRAVFGVIGGLFSVLTVFILTMFFTIFKDGICYTLIQFVPPQHQERVKEVSHLAAVKMGGWLRGQLTLALIISSITILGMVILKVPYAILIGFVAGLGGADPHDRRLSRSYPGVDHPPRRFADNLGTRLSRRLLLHFDDATGKLLPRPQGDAAQCRIASRHHHSRAAHRRHTAGHRGRLISHSPGRGWSRGAAGSGLPRHPAQIAPGNRRWSPGKLCADPRAEGRNAMNEMQQAAVATRVPMVLVSAGAGSGKTRVLTQRYLELLEKQQLRVDQILTLTFTRKAAQEMRGRIARMLDERKMVYQRRELARAPIGTIHSFCERILREHALEAGIDPNFRLLDDAEARTLRENALDSTFETVWADVRGQDEDSRTCCSNTRMPGCANRCWRFTAAPARRE